MHLVYGFLYVQVLTARSFVSTGLECTLVYIDFMSMGFQVLNVIIISIEGVGLFMLHLCHINTSLSSTAIGL